MTSSLETLLLNCPCFNSKGTEKNLSLTAYKNPTRMETELQVSRCFSPNQAVCKQGKNPEELV